jgi:hypothetical protein
MVVACIAVLAGWVGCGGDQGGSTPEAAPTSAVLGGDDVATPEGSDTGTEATTEATSVPTEIPTEIPTATPTEESTAVPSVTPTPTDTVSTESEP